MGEQNGQVISQPERDSSGALVLTSPEQHHLIQLDGHGEKRISPLDVTPWPHVGQSVRWLGEPTGRAEVIELPHNIHCVAEENDGLRQNGTVLSRTTYAALHEVQRYIGAEGPAVPLGAPRAPRV